MRRKIHIYKYYPTDEDNMQDKYVEDLHSVKRRSASSRWSRETDSPFTESMDRIDATIKSRV